MNQTVRWFLRFGLGAMAVLLACGVATAWFGNGLKMTATTVRDGSLVTLNRYAQEPTPDVVLVGSSLTNRLSESYFSTPRLRNLAFAGGSPVTGLEIVAARSQLPKLILVEANVLSRDVDTTMVDRYSRVDAGGPGSVHPMGVLRDSAREFLSSRYRSTGCAATEMFFWCARSTARVTSA